MAEQLSVEDEARLVWRNNGMAIQRINGFDWMISLLIPSPFEPCRNRASIHAQLFESQSAHAISYGHEGHSCA